MTRWGKGGEGMGRRDKWVKILGGGDEWVKNWGGLSSSSCSQSQLWNSISRSDNVAEAVETFFSAFSIMNASMISRPWRRWCPPAHVNVFSRVSTPSRSADFLENVFPALEVAANACTHRYAHIYTILLIACRPVFFFSRFYTLLIYLFVLPGTPNVFFVLFFCGCFRWRR